MRLCAPFRFDRELLVQPVIVMLSDDARRENCIRSAIASIEQGHDTILNASIAQEQEQSSTNLNPEEIERKRERINILAAQNRSFCKSIENNKTIINRLNEEISTFTERVIKGKKDEISIERARLVKALEQLDSKERTLDQEQEMFKRGPPTVPTLAEGKEENSVR